MFRYKLKRMFVQFRKLKDAPFKGRYIVISLSAYTAALYSSHCLMIKYFRDYNKNNPIEY